MVGILYHSIPMPLVALTLGLGILVLCQDNKTRLLLIRGGGDGRPHARVRLGLALFG